MILLLLACVCAFQVLHITDIHYDPSVESIAYDQDSSFSNVAIFAESLQKTLAQNNISAILWTGDAARHPNGRRRTLEEILMQNDIVGNLIRKAIGGTPILISIGNNDIHPHNFLEPQSAMIHQLADSWKWALGSNYHEFKKHGYYSRRIKGVVYISLNTMLFFNLNYGIQGCHSGSAGYHHLLWIRSIVDNPLVHHVIILGHVPPTVVGWFYDCLTLYAELMHVYKSKILGQFFGHVNVDHTFYLDWNRLHSMSLKASYVDWIEDHYVTIGHLKPSDSLIPVYVSPSVVPSYNPGYKLYEFNGKGVVDWTTFYYDIAGSKTWSKEYRFKEAFKGMDYLTLVKRIAKGKKESMLFWKYFFVGHQEEEEL